VQRIRFRDSVSAELPYPTRISNKFSEKTEKYISLREKNGVFRSVHPKNFLQKINFREFSRLAGLSPGALKDVVPDSGKKDDSRHSKKQAKTKKLCP
jgi:hypothetical protein